MLKDPKVRLAIQSFFTGLLTFLGAVQAQGISSMSADDWLNAVILGVVAALGFGGLMVTTPINQSVGIGATPKGK
jgi:hypothetical protein